MTSHTKFIVCLDNLNLSALKNILLLSDTHGYLDKNILSYAKNMDEIWHAGDIGNTIVIEKLKSLKPTKAVYGNIDCNKVRKLTKKILAFECEGIRVVITHIAGYPGRYDKNAKEIIQRYSPKLFICGHSHILKIMQDKKYGHIHFNPGACGIKGFHNKRTMLKFTLDDGKIKNLNVIELNNNQKLSKPINWSN